MSGAGRGAEGGQLAWPNREEAWAWSPVRVGPRGKRVREGKGWAAGIGFGPGFVGLGSLFYFYIYFLFLFLTQPQAK